MICVVADDLTGAAEIGGIGLRYQLKVEIGTAFNPHMKADLLVVATDTRSRKKEEAEKIIETITREIALLQPDLMYKKIDSALRGHIIPEIVAQLKGQGGRRALVVPANPSLGRTLINGIYLIDGKPIHWSSFSKDPEFAIITSEVKKILGESNVMPLLLQKSLEPMPARGIIIAEVRDSNDLKAWAGKIEKDTVVAGASEFFSVLLEANLVQATPLPPKNSGSVERPALYVCGSTFSKSLSLVQHEKSKGGPVSYMPAALMRTEEAPEEKYDQWTDEVISYLLEQGKAIIAIDPNLTHRVPMNPLALREKTAQVVARVCHKITVGELLLEGGSTASAILQRLGFHQFYPVQELAPGVIRMQIAGKPNMLLTLKPGSYHWPAGIW